ncbi:MAG: inner membrane CreD family protein, partial [Thermoanaerobaculia bacterium]
VYRWALPDDLGPLRELLAQLLIARVDALVVTSQVQVRHLWQVAVADGLAAALPEMLLGSVGLFAILALVMFLTRRIDWGNPQRANVTKVVTPG